VCPRIVRTGLNEQIYRHLRDRIVGGELPAGTRIGIEALCRDYSVSPTPVKDALRLLAGEGLVELRPRSGTFVRQPTPQDLIEVFGLRQVIELYAAEAIIRNATVQQVEKLRRLLDRGRRAAHRENLSGAWREFVLVDEEFHDVLISAAGNRHLLDLYRRLKAHNLVTLIQFPDTPARMRRAGSDHEAILDAASRRDVRSYRTAMKAHLENAQANLLRHVHNPVQARAAV